MTNGSRFYILAVLLFVCGCAGNRVMLAQSAVEGSFLRTLDVTGPVELDVSTGSGRIDVRSGPSGRVEVRGRVRASERSRGRQRAEELVRQLESNPPIDQKGSVIRIGYIEDPEARRNISISYDITVPQDTRLRSQTGSGSQTIDSIAGPVEATTGSGSITISGVQREAHAQTGSGSIRISNAGSNVSASTGSGSIVAESVAGGFRSHTGSGSIRLTQITGGDVEASTG
jgi:hypothetical protein